jgi:hypothetical protein
VPTTVAVSNWAQAVAGTSRQASNTNTMRFIWWFFLRRRV